jgi:hypothetical protein
VDVVGVELVVELADDPQAAASSATAATPAAIRIFTFKIVPPPTPAPPKRRENDRLDS